MWLCTLKVSNNIPNPSSLSNQHFLIIYYTKDHNIVFFPNDLFGKGAHFLWSSWHFISLIIHSGFLSPEEAGFFLGHTVLPLGKSQLGTVPPTNTIFISDEKRNSSSGQNKKTENINIWHATVVSSSLSITHENLWEHSRLKP